MLRTAPRSGVRRAFADRIFSRTVPFSAQRLGKTRLLGYKQRKHSRAVLYLTIAHAGISFGQKRKHTVWLFPLARVYGRWCAPFWGITFFFLETNNKLVKLDNSPAVILDRGKKMNV